MMVRLNRESSTPKPNLLGILGLSAGIFLPSVLPAQEPDRPEEAPELSEFRVTGTKLERSLFDTQESIGLVSAQIIEERDLIDLQEALPQVANVYTVIGQAFGIRGIPHNSAATQGGTGESGSYYFDGVALTGFSKRFGPDELWDVQQIEFLRGPQSTNVGRNALAGAVLINTRDPVSWSEAAARFRLATDETFGAALMGNTPIGKNAAARIALSYDSTEGAIENPIRGEDDYNAQSQFVARGKLRWSTRDNRVSLLLTGQYSEGETGGNIIIGQYLNDEGELIVQDPEDRISLANLEAFEDSQTALTSLRLDWEITDAWTLLSLSSYLDSDYQRFDDDDQLPTGGNSFRGREATDENWAQEIRLTYDAADALRGVFGVYLTSVDLLNDSNFLVNLNPALVGVPSALLPFYPEALEIETLSTFDSQTDNYAIFGELEYQLSPQWTVVAGARYDYEDQESNSLSTRISRTSLPDPNTPGLPPEVSAGIGQVNAQLNALLGEEATATSTTYEAFLPKVGVRFEPTEDLSLGLLYKRGYRAGGVDINSVGVRSEYDPEFLDNFELSLRSRWMDGKLGANVNVYYGIWTDQQVGVQVSDGNTLDLRTQNAGESEIYGFEFELRGKPSDRWDWFANVGFSHTEFTEFDSSEGDFAGNRFGFAPEWTASLGGSWEFISNWKLHGNLTYTSDAFTAPDNEFELDARTVTNLKLTYARGNHRLSLYADNVFDEVYLISNAPSLNPGSVFIAVGPPRQVGVTYSVIF